jgi:hypothetical protein
MKAYATWPSIDGGNSGQLTNRILKKHFVHGGLHDIEP